MRGVRYALSFPERIARAAGAALGGTVYETAQLVLPRALRRSRLYEATAKNVLRLSIELLGGVEAAPSTEAAVGARELALRKGAGNVVELGSIAAFGFSPLWLLAGASDVARGSRVYLDALVDELKRAEVLAEDAEVGSVDELLGVLERGSGRTARLVDIPPLELAEIRSTLAELRADADTLPGPEELASLYRALRRTAEAQDRSLLEVSTGVGLAILASMRSVSREHLVEPYREDWDPVRREGARRYARRVAHPYGRAVWRHLDPAQVTWTDRLVRRVSRATTRAR